MGRKKLSRKTSPREEKTTDTPRVGQSSVPTRTEEAEPSAAPPTPIMQTPATGTPQIPSIPLDLVTRLLESLSPGFNLTHTLARMAAENTNPILVQPTTELPEPSTKLTETLPEKEVELKPETPTSPTPKQPIDLQTPPKTPAEMPTKTSTKAPVDNPVTTSEDPTTGSVGEKGRVEEEVRDEELVEAGGERGVDKRVVESEVVVEAEEVLAYKKKELEAKAGEEPKFVEGIVEDSVESEKSVSEGEESGESEETKVVSEERTEVVGSGDEKNVVEKPSQEEEVDQVIEEEEREIVLLEEDDTVAGDKQEETADQRTTRRKTRMASRIAEILATGKDRQRGSEPSEAEKEEEEEIPLIRRPRSTRVTVTEETLIPATEENTPTPIDEEKEAEETVTDRKRYEKERKRKGKQLERLIKKKVRQAARNVVIQELIQVPYKQAKEKK